MRSKCPGCGKPYNGKRCSNCFYESFTEEIAHGGHAHEGEPLVDMGVESVHDIQTQEISLGIADTAEWDNWTQTGLLTADVSG